MRSVVYILMLAFGLQGCGSFEDQYESTRVQQRTSEETEFAKQILDALQLRSFKNNREYCGYIGVNEAGVFVATGPTLGETDACDLEAPPESTDVLASYHTHSGFSEDHLSERPSAIDLEGDIEDGIDGYVSTPGGRFWFNDAAKGEARAICGAYCLAYDPDYKPDDNAPTDTIYSLEELQE